MPFFFPFVRLFVHSSFFTFRFHFNFNCVGLALADECFETRRQILTWHAATLITACVSKAWMPFAFNIYAFFFSFFLFFLHFTFVSHVDDGRWQMLYFFCCLCVVVCTRFFQFGRFVAVENPDDRGTAISEFSFVIITVHIFTYFMHFNCHQDLIKSLVFQLAPHASKYSNEFFV